ncbi:MAG: TlpA family protein disulfide reductase [Kofleriaceae bacterium]
MRSLFVLWGLVIGLALAAGPAAADVLKKGDRLKELDVAVDASGKAFKLKAYKGKWLFVTAGAAWCVPCRKELPVWDRIAGELKGKITFVALTLDDDIKDGKAFHRKLKLRNMALVYLPSDKSAVAGSYGAATMPSSFIADPQGVVQYVHSGFEERNAEGEYKKMKQKLAELLK